MAEIFYRDDIDFSLYEQETEPKQKVKDAKIWVQELIDRIHDPIEVQQVVMPWPKTHGMLQFRAGEVTIWGGANGQGKSMITGQVALSLCLQRHKVCIASFEMKPIKTLERMGRQWSGDNPNHPTYQGVPEAKENLIKVYENFRDWTDGKLFLYDQQGTVNAKQVCAVVRYCVIEKGVTHVFIDSLMKCIRAEDDHNAQKALIDELTSIARDHNIHIHVIHHIKKPENEDYRPNKYDYKGSGSITDQVDNVISIWRNKPKERAREAGKKVNEQEPDCLLICDKQRNGEWEGQIGLWFERNSQQFLGSSGESAMLMFHHPADV